MLHDAATLESHSVRETVQAMSEKIVETVHGGIQYIDFSFFQDIELLMVLVYETKLL